MIFKVYRAEILKISSKNFQEKKFRNSEFQKFETGSDQFEPVCSSSFECFMNRAFIWYTYIHFESIYRVKDIRRKYEDVFQIWPVYPYCVFLKLFEFEPSLPNNKQSWLESVCIFQNTKTDFLIITPLLVSTIFTPSSLIRSN